MAIQLSTAVRDARLDQIETTVGTSPSLEIRTGAQPADCAAASTGTVLATMALPSDWMTAAAAGVKGKSGTWQDATADATGTAGHFRIFQGATCHMQGSITGSGGGGDLELNNTSIVILQQVTITQFDLTDGNA